MYFPEIDRAIRAAAIGRGVAHSAMAARLGVSDKTLREKRLGRRDFTASEVVALARMFKTEPSDLLRGATATPPADPELLPRGRGIRKQ